MKNPSVSCEETSHKATDCKKVITIDKWKRTVASKKFCFNYLYKGHRATECKSKGVCHNCSGKHHISICYKSVKYQPSAIEIHQKQSVMAKKKQDIIYHVEVILVDGIKCRVLLDTGAGSNYISLELARHLENF